MTIALGTERGGAAARRLAVAAALLLASSLGLPACSRRSSRHEEGDAGARAPSGDAIRALAPVVREGLAIAFELRPLSGPAIAGEEARAVFTVTDAASGAPVRGLRPLAWMSRRSSAAALDDAACKARVKGYLAGLLSAKADVDMSAYEVWTLGADGAIAVIDPTVSFSRTKLHAIIELKGRPADWAMSPDQRSVFVSLPASKEVAILDVERRAVVARAEVGEAPARVVPAPDGRRVWVGDDAGRAVHVIDARTGAVVKSLDVGAGRQAITFAEGGRTAWITAREAESAIAIDAGSLAVLGEVRVGRGAVAVAASDVAAAVYVARGDAGEVVAVDAARRIVKGRIGLSRGVSALRFDPAGRFAFAVNRAEGELAILDAASARVIRALSGLGAPESVAFTSRFAYVHQPAAAKMSVIERNTIDREGSLAAVEVPIGQAAAGEASDRAALIAPTPEGNSVMAVNPESADLHYFVEGMMAPVGANRGYVRAPRGLLVVDRSLSEIEPGVYATTVRLAGAGAHDVSLLLDRPRLAACFDQAVPAAPGSAPEGAGYALTPLFDPRARLAPGAPATLRFRVDGAAPLAAREIEVLILRSPGGYRLHERPSDEGGGVYAVTFTPPAPGWYRFLVAAPSRGAPLGAMPFLTLRAGGAEAERAMSTRGGEGP